MRCIGSFWVLRSFRGLKLGVVVACGMALIWVRGSNNVRTAIDSNASTRPNVLSMVFVSETKSFKQSTNGLRLWSRFESSSCLGVLGEMSLEVEERSVGYSKSQVVSVLLLVLREVVRLLVSTIGGSGTGGGLTGVYVYQSLTMKLSHI